MSRNEKNKKRGYVPKNAASSSTSSTATANWLWYGVLFVLIVAIASYFLTGRGGGSEITTPSGLKYIDEKAGDGASPAPGKMVTVHYTGTLANGTQFDSSRGGQPLPFKIGTGAVIKGWDEGVMTMKVGGKRKLIIPPDLGYGAMGRPPKIPGNSVLHFDVELLDVK